MQLKQTHAQLTSLRFDFPELPVSVNRLYTVKGGRKILSSDGRKYRNRFITSRGGVPVQDLIRFSGDNSGVYQIHIWCFLPYEQLYNITYGNDKRVKSPFGDVDADNFIKLAVDCISALVGIRDRNNFTVCAHKREAPDGLPRLVALIMPLDLELDPFAFPGGEG